MTNYWATMFEVCAWVQLDNADTLLALQVPVAQYSADFDGKFDAKR
jgi:hypothetical protein